MFFEMVKSVVLGVLHFSPVFPVHARWHAPRLLGILRTLGGDMVGMTMPREAKLAAELDLPYAAVCISSNWAAGRDPEDGAKALNHLDVSAQANDRLDPVWACILGMLE